MSTQGLADLRHAPGVRAHGNAEDHRGPDVKSDCWRWVVDGVLHRNLLHRRHHKERIGLVTLADEHTH